MKKDQFIYMPRLVLYVAGLLICGILLYIRFYVTPQVKNQSESRVEMLYQRGDFLEALQASQQMAARFPEEAIWQLHMGQCYDALKQSVDFQQKSREEYRRNLEQPFYSEAQKKELQLGIEGVELYLQKIPAGDLTAQALACYQKAYELSPSWRIGIRIVESHILCGRSEQASALLAKLPAPSAPTDVLEHALWQTELNAQLAEQNKFDAEAMAAQCRKTLQLFAALPAAVQSDKKLASRVGNSAIYLAQQVEQKGDLALARQYYQQASQLAPDNVSIYLAHAALVQRQNDYPQAEEILLQALRVAPQTMEIQYAMACVAMHLWKLDQALQSLEQALHANKRDAAQAVAQQVAGDAVWQRCYRHPEFQMLMGWFYATPALQVQPLREAIHMVWQKKFDAVAAICENLIRSDARSYPAYLLLVHTLIGQKSHKLAWERHLADNQKKLVVPGLTPLEKNELEREVAKTKIYIRSHRLAEFDLAKCDQLLAAHLQNVRQIGGNNPQIELAIVHAYAAYDMHEEVLATVQPLLAANLDKDLLALAYYLKGQAHWQLKQLGDAVTSFAKAWEAAPQVPMYTIMHARALLDDGQKDAAVAAYARALALTKGNPFYHYEGGLFLLGMQKLDEAGEQFRACVELRPSQYLGWYQLGKIALLQNKPDEALRMLEQAFRNKGNIEMLSKLLRTESEWKAVYASSEFRRILRSYQYRR